MFFLVFTDFDEWTPWLTHDFGLTSYSNRSRDCLENNVTVTDSHFCNGSNNETLGSWIVVAHIK